MARKLKKSYQFAIKSSLLITLTSTVSLGFLGCFIQKIALWMLLPYSLLLYIICFVILQYRVEKFIYKRIQKIYKQVSFLQDTDMDSRPITTDIKALSEEIHKFANDKKLEIQTLKIRENYRREYIGNISHELNTPLFTVQSYILTLLDGAMANKSLRKKYLTRAAQGVERLIFVVKDLEMISKLEAGELRLQYQEFDIVKVIQSVFEMFEMRANKRRISLIFDKFYKTPIYVYADKERIQQAIANLVINSIKYGRDNGTTEVSLEEVNNKVIVRITDNGEGVAKENIPRLFERFYRVDKSGNRNEGGSGLGLSIVKHIVEAHRQKIYVESFPGVGSEFSFSLEKFKPH